MGLLPHPVGKPKPKSIFSKNVKEFASRSTVHGVSYIFDRTVPLFDRFLWLIIFLGSASLAIFFIYSSYTDWQDNQVITTLKTVAKPVADLHFPAVTICAAGQHMGNVEKALYNNFKNWDETQPDTQKSLEDRFAQYMEETFQIRDKDMNILDILNTMISPSDEASGADAVRQNELACSNNNKRRKRSTYDEYTSKL